MATVKMKVLTHDRLTELNEAAIRQRADAVILRKRVEAVNPKFEKGRVDLFPILIAAGQSEHYVRCHVMLNGPEDLGVVDIPLDAFNRLPVNEVVNGDKETVNVDSLFD